MPRSRPPELPGSAPPKHDFGRRPTEEEQQRFSARLADEAHNARASFRALGINPDRPGPVQALADDFLGRRDGRTTTVEGMAEATLLDRLARIERRLSTVERYIESGLATDGGPDPGDAFDEFIHDPLTQLRLAREQALDIVQPMLAAGKPIGEVLAAAEQVYSFLNVQPELPPTPAPEAAP